MLAPGGLSAASGPLGPFLRIRAGLGLPPGLG